MPKTPLCIIRISPVEQTDMINSSKDIEQHIYPFLLS